MLNKEFILITPISVLLLLICSYLTTFSINIYFIVNFLVIIFLFLAYFIILINRKTIAISVNIINSFTIVYGIYMILLSRSLNYYTHAIIIVLYLFMFLIIIPNNVKSFKYIKNVSFVISLFILFLSIILIIKNVHTLYDFLNVGFIVKDYVTPIFTNINYDASLLVYGIFSSFLLWKYANKKIYFIITIIEIFALLLTYSRTEYLTILIMFLIYILITLKKVNKILLIFIITFIFSMILFLLLNQNIMIDLNGQGGNLLSGRNIIWEQAIKLIKSQVFFGHGLYFWEFFVSNKYSTHNSYLNILVEFGIFGIILYFILMLRILQVGFLSLKNKEFFKVKAIILSFNIGIFIGMIFETRRLGGIRIIDFLPLLTLSMILVLNKIKDK